MAFGLSITSKASLAEVESLLQSALEGLRDNRNFTARVSSDRRSSFFKDVWAAIAVATCHDRGVLAEIVAWGLKDWTKLEDEDGFALSLPSLIALQRGARVVTDGRPEVLDAWRVKRTIVQVSGVLGTGARQRTIVELDPDLPTAARLAGGGNRRNAFFEFTRSVLAQLEIGALARKGSSFPVREGVAKGTILEFLYELHTNAYEHARAQTNVRVLRLQKHQYPHRDGALRRAPDFEELQRYLHSQPEKPSNRVFNLIEASVTDFGPGILDGFLNTFAGIRHQNRPRRELIDEILHEQLSSKSSDPNAGLGIIQALNAARDLDAFVSLRTGEFWLTMQGRSGGSPRLIFRPGRFPRVIGTHWQMLLPDPTDALA